MVATPAPPAAVMVLPVVMQLPCSEGIGPTNRPAGKVSVNVRFSQIGTVLELDRVICSVEVPGAVGRDTGLNDLEMVGAAGGTVQLPMSDM
jgi:hypothetical protein